MRRRAAASRFAQLLGQRRHDGKGQAILAGKMDSHRVRVLSLAQHQARHRESREWVSAVDYGRTRTLAPRELAPQVHGEHQHDGRLLAVRPCAPVRRVGVASCLRRRQRLAFGATSHGRAVQQARHRAAVRQGPDSVHHSGGERWRGLGEAKIVRSVPRHSGRHSSRAPPSPCAQVNSSARRRRRELVLPVLRPKCSGQECRCCWPARWPCRSGGARPRPAAPTPAQPHACLCAVPRVAAKTGWCGPSAAAKRCRQPQSRPLWHWTSSASALSLPSRSRRWASESLTRSCCGARRSSGACMAACLWFHLTGGSQGALPVRAHPDTESPCLHPATLPAPSSPPGGC